MKNGFEIIDSHCHIYPEKIVDKAVHGTDTFYGVHSHCKGTVENLLAVGKEAGIDRFIVQSVATTPKQVKSINSFIAQEVSIHKELVGLGTLHQDSDCMEEDVLFIKELGLQGVKLHPDIQNFKIDEERYSHMFELCQKYKLPILMHTGDYRYDNSNPNRLKNILTRFPDLTIIGAHFGGWSIYEQASRELAGYNNLYVDCSSAFYYLDDKTIVEIINRYGVDRVFFGTDYPMWTPSVEIDRLLSLGLDETSLRKIFAENVKKLFNFN